MKQDIHPEFVNSTVTCSCGATIETASTKPALRIEICGICHPFYTGEQRIVGVDTTWMHKLLNHSRILTMVVADNISQSLSTNYFNA